MMELGGNQRAREFFRQHGGLVDWNKFSDTKYSSRVAEMYKSKLRGEVENDSKPGKKSSLEEATEKGKGKDVDSQEEEEHEVEAPKVVAKEMKSTETSGNGSKSASSLTSPNANVLGRKTTGGSLNKKMVAKKVTSDFFADFDAESDEEKEEPKEKKDNGKSGNKFFYDDDDEENPSNKKDEKSSKSASVSLTPAQRAQKASVGSDSFVPTRSKVEIQKEKEAKKDNGFGYAQQNFSKAKAISSQQFFGEEDKVDEADKRSRLSKFEGAKSISSASYYDRDEGNMGPDPDASDIARKIAYTAKNDLGQVKEIVADGTKKLAQMASNFFSELSERYQ